MKIINRPTQTGKTTMLIYTAHATDLPIITSSSHRANLIITQAEKLGVKGIKVFSLSEWMQINRSVNGMNSILIDEAGDFIADALEAYFASRVVACTVTFPMDEIPTESETVKEASNE